MGVLLTSCLLHKQMGVPLLGSSFWQAMVMALCVQASANLVNSIFDFHYGVDNAKTTGDRCLVDKQVTSAEASVLAGLLFAVGVTAVADRLAQEFLCFFIAGSVLAFCYTVLPLGLKYRALGDITIFVCFGPLLMQATALLMSGSLQLWILPYSVPHALLTEAILHANNTRDMKEDAQCGIVTIPILLGFERSKILYFAMVCGAYAWALWLSLQHVGAALVLLSAPIAWQVLSKFNRGPSMHEMDAETAKLHLAFCMLMNIGLAVAY
jgi:1,4-dihydroxy-2-naphthoate octaprenyltransferase